MRQWALCPGAALGMRHHVKAAAVSRFSVLHVPFSELMRHDSICHVAQYYFPPALESAEAIPSFHYQGKN